MLKMSKMYEIMKLPVTLEFVREDGWCHGAVQPLILGPDRVVLPVLRTSFICGLFEVPDDIERFWVTLSSEETTESYRLMPYLWRWPGQNPERLRKATMFRQDQKKESDKFLEFSLDNEVWHDLIDMVARLPGSKGVQFSVEIEE